MSIPIPLKGGAFHIDNSSMERFTTCPRSAQYNYFLKRQRNWDRAALEFGKIIHKALELKYLNLDKPLKVVEGMQIQCLTDEFEKFHPPEEDHRTYAFACEVIFAYNQHYPIEAIEIAVNKDGKLMVENPFAVPLGFVVLNVDAIGIENGVVVQIPAGQPIPVVWTGKFDLAYWTTIGSRDFHLMDHKTTSQLGEGFYREFELSHATHGYAWALEKIMGIPVHGYTINALACRKPTKTGKGIEFERKSVVIERSLLEEWEQDTLYIVQNMCQQAAEGYFPKHTKWCVGKYGTCEYHMLCNTPPSSRQVILDSGEFKDVTWSPHNND